MLLGRLVGAAQARGHLAVAAALTERLGGRTDLALALLDDAIDRFTAVGDTFGIGYALGQRGHTLRWAGDLAGALACFDAAEQVHRSLRDLRSIAMALAGRSYIAALLGEPTIARRRVEEAVSMMERSGDIAGVAHTLNIQGLIELELGVVDAALPPLERSLFLADRGVTPAYAIGWEYLLVAHLRRAVGDADASARAAAEAAVRFQALGDRRGRASPAKSAQRRCRHDDVLRHDSERGRHDTGCSATRPSTSSRRDSRVRSCGPATVSTRRHGTSGTAPSTSTRQ